MSQKNFFWILVFWIGPTMYRWSMMKNIHSPNWVEIGSWGPEIWPHEYLISPIEISVNWSGSKQLWTRPIYTDFNGLIRYSCGYISGHHEPIHVKFGVWGFFLHVLLKYHHENAEMQKRKYDDVTPQYSLNGFYGILSHKADHSDIWCKAYRKIRSDFIGRETDWMEQFNRKISKNVIINIIRNILTFLASTLAPQSTHNLMKSKSFFLQAACSGVSPLVLRLTFSCSSLSCCNNSLPSARLPASAARTRGMLSSWKKKL